MICKVCGYESNENFSICPYCGEEINSQNQAYFTNQNQYNQNPFNQNNQYDPSQYQTPFTKPNPQPNNQYNQANQYNNYNSAQTNNYQNQSYRPVPVARHHKVYGSNMPDNFKGFGCTFEVTQNDLYMSRNLNGGDFVFWSIIAIVLGVFLIGFGPVFLPFFGPLLSDFSPFFIIVLFIFLVGSSLFLTNAKIRVNSTGITIKTILKEYFLPREKIDSLVCRTVTRSKGRYGRESFYDVFIVMKDKSVSNKLNLDTGLCYKNKIHVDYLIDMFNERLGFL